MKEKHSKKRSGFRHHMEHLLVADHERVHAGAAEHYLASRGLDVAVAHDYLEAQHMLRHCDFNGIITDSFLPESEGTGRTQKGIDFLERMAQEDPQEQHVAAQLEKLASYMDLSDPLLHTYARHYVHTSGYADILEDPLIRSLPLGKERCHGVAMNALGGLYKAREYDGDPYNNLRAAIQSHEAHQPLGVRVAEESSQLGPPVVMTTPGYHLYTLMQPVRNYATHRGIPLVECISSRDKEGTQFWRKAYSVLRQQ